MERLAAARAAHAREVAPLLSLVALAARRREEALAFANAAATATSQADALRGELAAAASSSTAQSGGASSAAVSRLQGKLLEAQEQLNAALRESSESHKANLGLAEAAQRFREEASAAHAAAAVATAAAASAAEDIKRLRSALVEREAQLSTAAEELVRARNALAAKATEAESLRTELGGAPAEKARAVAEAEEERRMTREARRDAERSSALLAGAQARIVELTRALQAAGGGMSVPESASGAAASAPTMLVQAPATQTAPPAAAAAPVSGGLTSWVGKMAAAVRVAASSALPAPMPSANPSAVPAVPVPSSLALPQPAGAPTYMSASVISMASDYVFASLPPPSRVQTVIRAHSTEINAVHLHESGRLLAAGASDGAVSLWAPSTGGREGVLYACAEGVAVLAIDAYGPVLAAAYSDRAVRVFDLTTQRLSRALNGHAGKVQALVYVPPTPAATVSAAAGGAGGGVASNSGSGGRGLLISGSADRTVKMWDLRDGRCARTLDARSIVNGVALSADGMLLAAACQDSGVRLFDVRAAGRTLAEAPAAHSAAVTSVSFSRDSASAKLLTASRDNTLRMLDGRTLEPLGAFAPPSAALAGGGAPLAAAPVSPQAVPRFGSSAAVVMRAQGFRLPVNTSRALFSASGACAVAGGDKGAIWSFLAETGALEAETVGADSPHDGAAIFALDVAGHLMASGDDRGTVVVWADG